MPKSIDVDSFYSEIIMEERPVLLAYIRRDYEYREQTEVLESVSKMYGDAVKACVLDEEPIGEFKKLGIDGDPIFFVFYEGKERGRMFGKADIETLSLFVFQSLPNFQDVNRARI